MLQSKVAIVTGAGSGIGRAVARALQVAGARVALLGRRKELVEEAREAIHAEPGTTLTFEVDVTHRAALAAAIKAIEESWGRIDILVNNAGTNTPRRALEDIAPEDWDQVVGVNLTGAYNATRACLPALRRCGAGIVINIGSTSSLRPTRLAGIAYVSSKHAIVGFSACIALEERKHGIRATAIHPGEVDTAILEKRPTPVSAERRRLMLRPEDIAEAVVFAATRPPHVSVPTMVVEPSSQEF